MKASGATTRIVHNLANMFRARMCRLRLEEAADHYFLRSDPLFKLACGRLLISAMISARLVKMAL